MRRRQRLDVEKKRSQIKARRPEWGATDGMIKDKGETLESHVGFCGDHMDWLAMEEWGAARRRGKRRRHGGADDGPRSRWNARIRMNARCGVILMLLRSEASEKSWILFRALRRDSRRPWRGKPGSRAFFFPMLLLSGAFLQSIMRFSWPSEALRRYYRYNSDWVKWVRPWLTLKAQCAEFREIEQQIED